MKKQRFMLCECVCFFGFLTPVSYRFLCILLSAKSCRSVSDFVLKVENYGQNDQTYKNQLNLYKINGIIVAVE